MAFFLLPHSVSFAYYNVGGMVMENNIYIVQSGDTLYDIAKRFNTTVEALAHYNGIADPNVIKIGQMIRIPEMEDGECVPIHIIKSGDSLQQIADMHDTTVHEIARLNGIQNPDYIEAGRVLRLPKDAKYNCYRVEQGDSLWKIAQKYGVTVTQLINENRLKKPSLIYPGQIIRIPV